MCISYIVWLYNLQYHWGCYYVLLKGMDYILFFFKLCSKLNFGFNIKKRLIMNFELCPLFSS